MTIAFGQIYYFVASKWTSVTHGEDGLLNIARLPAQLGVVDLPTAGNVEFYYLCFAAYAVLVVLLWRLTNSPYGRVLRAIKQNPTRVAFVGYPVTIRSEEHTSELQSLMRISYAVFCLKKKKTNTHTN